MNKKIKFRVWDDLEKIFLHNKGFHDVIFRDNGLCFPYGTGHSTQEYPNRFIVEQFTGLEDKNGKEIYEGDILYHFNERMDVFIKRGDGGFVFVSKTKKHPEEGHYITKAYSSEMSIVGNIHMIPHICKKIAQLSGCHRTRSNIKNKK